MEDCHAFVAVSDSDEHNILGAMQAKGLGAPKTVVVVQQPTYLHLLSRIGIDYPYSPRIVAAQEVLRLIHDSPVWRLATLSEKVADVYEIASVRNGAAADKPLREVWLPQGAFVAAVQRAGGVHLPSADDTNKDYPVCCLILICTVAPYHMKHSPQDNCHNHQNNWDYSP